MENKWTTVIMAKTRLLDVNIKELIQYRDLILIFVKRNYSTRYKQTILGPLWLLISPLFTIITYSIVFGGIAGLSTDGIPKPLFYLAGNVIWSFFASSVTNTANTFTGNAGLFGKIYFPRLVSPISTVLTSLLDFCIQMLLMLVLMLFYTLHGEKIFITRTILLLPLVLLQLGMLGLGVGIIISSITTKYRDLCVLVGFGMQIWMYASPVIYSLTLVPDKFRNLFMLNPVTSAIIIFKNSFLGLDYLPIKSWGISWIITIVVLFFGVIIFNKVEKTFMDTV